MNTKKLLREYAHGQSLRELSEEFCVSWQKVRKILITQGAYDSTLSREILWLFRSGLSRREIAKIKACSYSKICSYLPYTAAPYTGVSRTTLWRKKRQAEN
jgi:hypothetical protein